ncbi:MAG: restriction endonuclease subunit S, partial [Bacteroidetes bacterium]|nr:restriction endonuclease subunit S [Bacteroidota bacterium]
TYLLNFIQRHYQTIQSSPKGTGIPHVNPDIFWNLQIPLPPLNEQKRIVEKLDAILPKVKNAKARLEKIPVILKKFRQSILSAACSGRLTEDWRDGKEKLPVVIAPNVTSEHDLDIPESWVVCRAKDACINVESGSTPKGKPFTATGEIPYLKVYNIVNQNINFDYKPQFIPKTVHEKELKRCKCYPNDVLMNIVGPPLGKIAMVTDQFPEWNINQAIVVYRPQNFLTSLFLYYWLSSLEPIKETLKETRGSAGQVNISLTQARNIFVPLPPLEEQQEIVRRVEKLFTLADSLQAKYTKAIQRVEKIEQSVLAKAFKGELADPDPNDEPAAELLNRIHEEKAKLESTKKPRSNRSGKPSYH